MKKNIVIIGLAAMTAGGIVACYGIVFGHALHVIVGGAVSMILWAVFSNKDPNEIALNETIANREKEQVLKNLDKVEWDKAQRDLQDKAKEEEVSLAAIARRKESEAHRKEAEAKLKNAQYKRALAEADEANARVDLAKAKSKSLI
jgi:hypothetical protein